MPAFFQIVHLSHTYARKKIYVEHMLTASDCLETLKKKQHFFAMWLLAGYVASGSKHPRMQPMWSPS